MRRTALFASCLVPSVGSAQIFVSATALFTANATCDPRQVDQNTASVPDAIDVVTVSAFTTCSSGTLTSTVTSAPDGVNATIQSTSSASAPTAFATTVGNPGGNLFLTLTSPNEVEVEL